MTKNKSPGLLQQYKNSFQYKIDHHREAQNETFIDDIPSWALAAEDPVVEWLSFSNHDRDVDRRFETRLHSNFLWRVLEQDT